MDLVHVCAISVSTSVSLPGSGFRSWSTQWLPTSYLVQIRYSSAYLWAVLDSGESATSISRASSRTASRSGTPLSRRAQTPPSTPCADVGFISVFRRLKQRVARSRFRVWIGSRYHPSTYGAGPRRSAGPALPSPSFCCRISPRVAGPRFSASSHLRG